MGIIYEHEKLNYNTIQVTTLSKLKYYMENLHMNVFRVKYETRHYINNNSKNLLILKLVNNTLLIHSH